MYEPKAGRQKQVMHLDKGMCCVSATLVPAIGSNVIEMRKDTFGTRQYLRFRALSLELKDASAGSEIHRVYCGVQPYGFHEAWRCGSVNFEDGTICRIGLGVELQNSSLVPKCLALRFGMAVEVVQVATARLECFRFECDIGQASLTCPNTQFADVGSTIDENTTRLNIQRIEAVLSGQNVNAVHHAALIAPVAASATDVDLFGI